MNSRERVFTALKRKQPDRIPILEWIIDPKVMDRTYKDISYQDFIDRIGLDGIGVNSAYDYWTDVEIVDEKRRVIRDKWGVVRGFGQEVGSCPIEGPIKSPHDLKSYEPPDPNADGVLGILPDVVKRFGGKKAVFWFCHDGFIHATYLRGMENLLMDYVLNPKFAKELTEMCLQYNIGEVRRAVRAGAEIIILSDDYASKDGPLMSPGHFKEFVLPGLRTMVREAKKEGAYVVKHCCGNIWPIMDMLVNTGIDGINPLEPAAGIDIAEVKHKYGDKVCLIGNIDCGTVLSKASPDEVIEAVKECILKASIGGGHIMSSSSSVHSSVKPENYVAMVSATREYGRYPLNLENLGQ